MPDNGSISTLDGHDAGIDAGIDAAKLRLREWGVDADEEVGAQLAAVKSQVRGAMPWILGAGILTALFSGRGGKRAKEESKPSSHPAGRFVKVAKVAFELMPVILPLVARWGKRR